MTTAHHVHPRHAQILEIKEHYLTRRLFLESFHSTIDKNYVNERRDFPKVYLPLIKNFKQCYSIETFFILQLFSHYLPSMTAFILLIFQAFMNTVP